MKVKVRPLRIKVRSRQGKVGSEIISQSPVEGGHLPGENDFKTIGDMKLNEMEIIRHKLQDG